ncbi:hypothetical protein [[Mycoplasma] collis]|uniref:hypothetical protein n=1 Tax=[Mycoplasma] collis TaxID=2127 RepID=UPI00051BF75C|nr:hypothetical protein [[Mycoplasma] collis]
MKKIKKIFLPLILTTTLFSFISCVYKNGDQYDFKTNLEIKDSLREDETYSVISTNETRMNRNFVKYFLKKENIQYNENNILQAIKDNKNLLAKYDNSVIKNFEEYKNLFNNGVTWPKINEVRNLTINEKFFSDYFLVFIRGYEVTRNTTPSENNYKIPAFLRLNLIEQKIKIKIQKEKIISNSTERKALFYKSYGWFFVVKKPNDSNLDNIQTNLEIKYID